MKPKIYGMERLRKRRKDWGWWVWVPGRVGMRLLDVLDSWTEATAALESWASDPYAKQIRIRVEVPRHTEAEQEAWESHQTNPADLRAIRKRARKTDAHA